jgi:hypothetical protein
MSLKCGIDGCDKAFSSESYRMTHWSKHHPHSFAQRLMSAFINVTVSCGSVLTFKLFVLVFPDDLDGDNTRTASASSSVCVHSFGTW